MLTLNDNQLNLLRELLREVTMLDDQADELDDRAVTAVIGRPREDVEEDAEWDSAMRDLAEVYDLVEGGGE